MKAISVNYRGWAAVAVLALSIGACNPAPGSGVRVEDGVGILDYFTVRADEEGNVVPRDISPEEQPREAIRGDDYFQIKLEHIYIGGVLGRDVGNVAIITQFDGVVPDSVSCHEIDVADLEFQLNQRERASIARRNCAFNHVVAINPVFRDSHVTFDSTFITPPFRMGLEPVGLRFIIAQLNDVELAQQLMGWAETAVNNLGSLGLSELSSWQSEIVNIGFTVANFILDYASTPTYVFEFETDFVPIETVGGVSTPQNLFMGGDFVIVGMPRSDDEAGDLAASLVSQLDPAAARAINGQESTEHLGALVAGRDLIYNSGRLYHRSTGAEYRDGPYIIFKVVRQSRFPGELPITLARMNREIERGGDADQAAQMSRTAVLDLQEMRVLNETEGRYLLDLFDWFADARNLESDLNGAAFENERPPMEDWALQLQNVPVSIGPELALAGTLSQAHTSLERLQERIYENYGRTPGMWQAECVALRSVTQGLSDAYEHLYPDVLFAYQRLQTERNDLQRNQRRSRDQDAELDGLEAAELWVGRQMNDLPERLVEPDCPALRR